MKNQKKNNDIYYKIIKKSSSTIENETILANNILKEMIDELNLEFDEIKKTNNGKPYFKNKKTFFNYSHSKNYILIALSTTNIGVDIEEDRVIPDNVAKKYLNDIDKSNRLKYWVIKESYVKLIDEPKLLYEDIDIKNIKYNKYILKDENYIASIIYEGEKRELIEI